MMRVFTCVDCGSEVFQAVDLSANDDGDLCLTCAWIRNAPEADRAELRKFLAEDRKKENEDG
jgi:hypothetical protein